MTSVEAAKTLGVALPVSLNALKTAYRRRSHEEHPDVSKHPQAAERFLALTIAYEHLQADPRALEYSAEDARRLLTDDGTPLAELGKGLGPKTNGRPCDDCTGRGYRSYKIDGMRCPKCRPYYLNIFHRAWEYLCRKCNGSGKFKNKGECFPCRGTGWTRTTSGRNTCVACKGTEIVENPQAPVAHVKCAGCKGTGELMVFNPVLPKGLLAGR
jgi:DnaJ-class molecular chaperone